MYLMKNENTIKHNPILNLNRNHAECKLFTPFNFIAYIPDILEENTYGWTTVQFQTSRSVQTT